MWSSNMIRTTNQNIKMHNGNEQTYTVHTHTHTRRAVCWPHFTFTTNDHVLDSAVTVRVPSVRVASRAYRESIHSDELICMPSAQQQRLCLCIDDNLIVHESQFISNQYTTFCFLFTVKQLTCRTNAIRI